MKWAYGVTTVPERRDTLLEATLISLRMAGFDEPHLFVDGENNSLYWHRQFNLPTTCRWPRVRTVGNWVLGIYELYQLEPHADRYAMFQDDFVTYRNLRQYLEACPYISGTYLNLYTFSSNHAHCPYVNFKPTDPGPRCTGWYKSNQLGRGAVALIFDRAALLSLLKASSLVDKPMHPTRGWRSVDGGIQTALVVGAKYKELVHNPSLVQHTGKVSSMGNKEHKQAEWFMGEGYDALELLKADTYRQYTG